MNYSLNHFVLREPLFDNLVGTERRTVWMVLCAIRHFTKHVGHIDLYTTKYSEDIGVHKNTVRNALKLLVEKKYIKITKVYQRKGNIPNRYVSLKVGPLESKVVPPNTKGGSAGDTVNNSNRIIKQNNIDINISNDSLIVGSLAWVEAKLKKQNKEQ